MDVDPIQNKLPTLSLLMNMTRDSPAVGVPVSPLVDLRVTEVRAAAKLCASISEQSSTTLHMAHHMPP